MERGWRRRGGWLEIGRDRIRATVREAFPAAEVLAAEPLSGGLRNTNLRLSLAGAPSPLVLRLYVLDPNACCRESSVLVSLPDGLPVPEVHHACSTADPPWALLGWMDGVPADRALATADADAALEFAATCGAALAAIHRLEFAGPGFLGPALSVVAPMEPWSAILPVLADAVRPLLGERLFAGLIAAVGRRAGEVDPLFAKAVLCHGDFKPWNLLVEPAGERLRLAAILDWEFAFAGPALFDAGTFLRDEASRPRGYAAAFERGYRDAGGSLPPEWRRLSRLLDLVNLCQLLVNGDDRTAADLIPIVEATVGEG